MLPRVLGDVAAPKAPWAMVPLKPNELRRDSPPPRAARGSTSTGIWNAPKDTSDDRCAFSLKAWLVRQKTEKRAAKPTRAAARSRQRPPPTGVPPPTTRDPRPRPRPRGGPRLTSATRTGAPCRVRRDSPGRIAPWQRRPPAERTPVSRRSRVRSKRAPLWDLQAPCQCRALPKPARCKRRIRPLPLLLAAAGTTRWAP